MSRVSAGVGPLLFAVAWPVMGLGASFAVALALVAAAVMAMLLLAPETAGRDLR